MRKNTATKIAFAAYDGNGLPKTGDAANITAYVSKAAAAPAALADTSATELSSTTAPGVYAFDVTAGETNADSLVFSAVSTTVNIKLDPVIAFTELQTGDAFAVVDDSAFGNAKLVRSTTPANTLDVAATGEAGLDFNNIKDATGAHTLTNITVPTTTAVTALPAKNDDVVDSGTVVAASLSAVQLATSASTTAEFYDSCLVRILTGTGASQARVIVGYSTGRNATVDRPWTVTPDATSTYAVYARDLPKLNTLGSVVVDAVLGSVTGSVASVAAGVALAPAAVQAIWDALTSALTTAGSIGKWILDKLDVLVSSRSTYAGGDTPGTGTLLTRIPGTVQPQTGDGFAQVVAMRAAYTDARGPKLDNLDVTVGSRMATFVYTAPPTDYQQRAVVVTLPSPAPAGYGGSSGSSPGAGLVAINHNTGGADTLRITNASGAAISGAIIRAYLASEYAAGNLSIIRDYAVTGADGRWLSPMYLPQNATYTLTIDKPGAYAVAAVNVAA